MPAPAVRRQTFLAFALAMTAGYVDGFGLLAFNTYLSFMSGNTTQTGANAGRAAFERAVPSSIAIFCFLVGLFLGHLWQSSAEPGRSFDGESSTCRPLWTVGVMLVAASVAIHFRWLGSNAVIAFVALAMGIMNTAFTRVGSEPVNLTFVTGTLNKIGAHLALAIRRRPLEDAIGPKDTHISRALLLTLIWAAFLGGAILAGMVTGRLGAWALLPPGIFLCAYGAAGLRRPVRARGD
ncbi:MAG: YoaK family protein [Phycisphaerales bacterium]|nr:DUF1275 domain-containing protein [Planctomycetota bacterium]